MSEFKYGDRILYLQDGKAYRAEFIAYVPEQRIGKNQEILYRVAGETGERYTDVSNIIPSPPR